MFLFERRVGIEEGTDPPVPFSAFGRPHTDTLNDTRANPLDRCPTWWYNRAMGTLRVTPDWVKIAPTVLTDGRNGATITFPDDVLGEVQVDLDLVMLGQISAEADGLRETAMAWG